MSEVDIISQIQRSYSALVVMVHKKYFSYYKDLSLLFNASTIVEAFIEIVHNLHGIPNIIASNIDPIFTRKHWTKLSSCLGPSWLTTHLIILNLMGKMRQWTNFRKAIFVALQLINKHNGWNGCLWHSGGKILVSIDHQKCLHLWHFTLEEISTQNGPPKMK